MNYSWKTILWVFFLSTAQLMGQLHELHKSNSPQSESDTVGRSLQGSLSDYDVLHYRLDLRFPLTSSWFEGKVTLTGVSRRNGLNEVSLNSINLNIDSVSVQGKTAAWLWADGLIRIQLNRPFAAGDTFAVHVAYNTAPESRGFYFYSLCAYTFSEPEDARYWFPCRDVPWDKATAELHVTVPAGVKVASIGLLKSRALSPDRKSETFHWETRHPVATYLVCVTLSKNWSQWSDWAVIAPNDSLEIVNFVFQRDSAKAVRDLIHLKDAVAFFSRQFGSYPFEKYGQAEVEPFKFGGMEHQTMTTFNSQWIQGDRSYEGGFVHELAHMWWGDAVTLADWPDMWLNEGFAQYCEALFFESFYGRSAFQDKIQEMKRFYFNQADHADFPVYNPPFGQLFNWGIVYNKGGLVLHMLRRVVGEDVFWRILSDYFKTYRYRNASTSDFQSVCELDSKKELDWFFQEWIYGKGFPELAYSYSKQPFETGGVRITFQIQQIQKSGTLFRMPLSIRFTGVLDTVVQIEKVSDTWTFVLKQNPDTVLLDPDNWVLMKTEKASNTIREEDDLPDRFALYPGFPNPFNAETTVYYDIPGVPDVSEVNLTVYDVLGKPLRQLIHTEHPVSGKYQVVWDGKDAAGNSLASGVYILKMRAGRFVQEQKAVLTR